MQATFKPINSKSNVKEIKITNEFGLIETYTINFSTYIEPETYEPDKCNYCKRGIPELITNFDIQLKGITKTKNVISRDEIVKIMRGKNIIPPKLVYDHILLGFVYSDSGDPNNFRWWLDFKDSKNQSVYHCYADKLEVNCPVTTKSWHDQDPNGIWHGRFVLSPSEIRTILEPKSGVLKIYGKLKSECKPIDTKKVCSVANIPDKTESLRLRYNIREDIWFCDILDKEDKQIGQIPCKSIICDAQMYGEVSTVGERPKVSTRINIKDISDVAIAINSLIIRGN